MRALCALFLIAGAVHPQEPPAPDTARLQDPFSPPAFQGLRLRSIGPALMPGRVAPTGYIGVGSGGAWKTTNANIAFTPVLESANIGRIAVDPHGSNAFTPAQHGQPLNYQIAADEFAAEHARLKSLLETDLKRFQQQLDAAGVPYTPGRMPDFR